MKNLLCVLLIMAFTSGCSHSVKAPMKEYGFSPSINAYAKKSKKNSKYKPKVEGRAQRIFGSFVAGVGLGLLLNSGHAELSGEKLGKEQAIIGASSILIGSFIYLLAPPPKKTKNKK